MNKISREECYQTALVNLWNHIDALQKEVERLERVGSDRKTMTVEEIERVLAPVLGYLDKGPWNEMIETIQPLTVQQGFTPDWSKAPEGTVGCVAFFTGSVEAYWKPGATGGDNVTFIPCPAPKTRERTTEQLCLAWVKWAEKNSTSAWIPEMELATRLANGEKLDDLCRAAGIDLTVTEE